MTFRSRLFATVALPVLSASMIATPSLADALVKPFEVAQDSGDQGQPTDEELLLKKQQEEQRRAAEEEARRQAEEQQRAHNLEALIDRVVSKPFSLKEICAAVDAALQARIAAN